MKKARGIALVLILPVFFVSLFACAPAEHSQTDITTVPATSIAAGNTSLNTTVSTVLSTTTISTTTTEVTQTKGTVGTVKTTNPTQTTTTTAQLNPNQSIVEISPVRRPQYVEVDLDTDLFFSYDSEDYADLRATILREFPNEKDLDEYSVSKQEYGSPIYGGATYEVSFRRYINGFRTEAAYLFSFLPDGRCVHFEGRCIVYDASKVAKLRVPTEAEIEFAKAAEKAKIPNGCVVWKQEIKGPYYSISADIVYVSVETLYVSEKTAELYLEEDGPNYGKTPPCAMFNATYSLLR